MFGFILSMVVLSMIVYYIQYTVNFFQIGDMSYGKPVSRFTKKGDVKRFLVPYTMWFDSLKDRLNKLQ